MEDNERIWASETERVAKGGEVKKEGETRRIYFGTQTNVGGQPFQYSRLDAVALAGEDEAPWS